MLYKNKKAFGSRLCKWSIRDSNPWPQQCECCALPTALMPHEDKYSINRKKSNKILHLSFTNDIFGSSRLTG